MKDQTTFQIGEEVDFIVRGNGEYDDDDVLTGVITALNETRATIRGPFFIPYKDVFKLKKPHPPANS